VFTRNSSRAGLASVEQAFQQPSSYNVFSSVKKTGSIHVFSAGMHSLIKFLFFAACRQYKGQIQRGKPDGTATLFNFEILVLKELTP